MNMLISLKILQDINMNNYDWEKEVNVRYAGTNILLIIISFCIRIFELIVGVRKKGKLAVSKEKLRITLTNYFLWIIKRNEETLFISLSRINAFSIGYARGGLVKRTTTSLFVSGMEPVVIIYKDASYDEVLSKFNEIVK